MKVLLRGLVFLASLHFTQLAQACSCSDPPPLADEVARVGYVFTGLVESVEQVTYHTDLGDFSYKKVVLTTHQIWKGSVTPTFEVWTASNDGMCGVGFQPGEEWLVFAFPADGYAESDPQVPTTGSCSRTGLAAGNPNIPLLGPTPPPASTWGSLKASYR